MDDNNFTPEINPEITETQERVLRVSKKKLIIVAIVTLVLYVVVVGIINLQSSSTGLDNSDIYYNVPSVPTSNMGSPYIDSYRSNQGTPDITDTREFLKTSYSALIYTRNVHSVVQRVEGAVRNVEGRVDGVQSAEMSGRVNFTIAKDNLAEFRAAVGEITSAKLYTETISSQNLLAQKQGIEERTTTAVKTLTELEQEKAVLDQTHEARVEQIQSQITNAQQRLSSVRQDIATLEAEGAGTSSIAMARRSEERTLISQVAGYQTALTNENRTYSTKNSSLVSQINAAGGNLEEVIDQDVDFTNNIETVSGYVDVRWISYWEIGNKFSPTPMWVNTIILFFVIYWVLRRKKIAPRIELI